MGFPFDGLKSLVQSAAATIAQLVGQDIVAKSISLSQDSGASAVLLQTTGARLKLSSAGTTDYMTSNGSDTLVAAGSFTTASVHTFGAAMQPGANAAYRMASAQSWGFNTAPTISAGFGTSPTIASSNGSIAFRVNVGTGGIATSGTIGLPTATTGWVVLVQNLSSNNATQFITKQTASTTTSATIGNFDAAGAAAAWAASDVLSVIAIAI